MDMIPDKILVSPPGGHGESRASQKGFNLVEHTCAYCGETFYRRIGCVAYERTRNGKLLRFCSWSHKCADARENSTKKSVQERIDDKMQKMIKDRALLNSEKGQMLGEKEKQRIINRLQRLHKEVKALREMEEHESAGGVRGIASGDH